MLSAFLHGLLLAFGLIMPLGPQNMFLLNEGMNSTKIVKSLPVVLVISLCDTSLILLAVFGVGTVVLKVPEIRYTMMIGGIVFLFYMGYLNFKRFRQSPTELATQTPATICQKILYSAAISLLNPHAIIDSMGVIGTSALAYYNNDKVAFTLACIMNSWLWFFGLVLVGKYLGSNQYIRQKLNLLSAVVMWICAFMLAKMAFAL